MTATIVKELDDYGARKGGSACLVEFQGKHYVASHVPSAFDTGQPETLVFLADESGEVIDWMDVAGGRHMSREQAIADLEARGGDQ
jgi:hypothetical protein